MSARADEIERLHALLREAAELLNGAKSGLRDPQLAMSWGRRRRAIQDAVFELDQPGRVEVVEQCAICGQPEGPHQGPIISAVVMRLHVAAAERGMGAFEQVPAPSLGDPDTTVRGGPEFIP
jgi:hypothetical protein